MIAFSERPPLSQISLLVGMILGIGSVVFGAALWASDKAIDSIYATDDDLASMQMVVTEQMTRIEKTVNDNTSQVKATAASVDGLTMVVLDLQISRTEHELTELEKQKQTLGPSWSTNQERDLREHARAINQLVAQRQELVSRLTAIN